MLVSSSLSIGHPSLPLPRTLGTRITRRDAKGSCWFMNNVILAPKMMSLKVMMEEKWPPFPLLILHPLHSSTLPVRTHHHHHHQPQVSHG
jgi:hypothetical protein